MNKSELINRLAEKADLPHKRVEQVVNLLFDSMTDSLVQGDRIEIRGFGSFVAKNYRSRMGRNPKTGASIPVDAKRRPVFKVGKELRERVDAPNSKSNSGESGQPDSLQAGAQSQPG